jgi:hypothetical protein
LLSRAQVQGRDDLAEMFGKRMALFETRAKEELALIRERQRETTASDLEHGHHHFRYRLPTGIAYERWRVQVPPGATNGLPRVIGRDHHRIGLARQDGQDLGVAASRERMALQRAGQARHFNEKRSIGWLRRAYLHQSNHATTHAVGWTASSNLS